MSTTIPSSILIIGSGVFGLSTAYALAQRSEYKNTKIIVVDRVSFPAPDAASIDSSRLVRDDYDDFAYATLAAEALTQWRGDFGAEGRYTESGLAILTDSDGSEEARAVCDAMLQNVQKLGLNAGTRADGAPIVVLKDRSEVAAAMPGFSGPVGDNGYVNYKSGWAHAENGMLHMRRLVEATGRVDFRVAEVESIIFDRSESQQQVLGAQLQTGEKLLADQTVLAAGAWSAKFIDLRGVATATGQTLAYISITDEEQARLLQNPAILNTSNDMYIIQPRDNILKIARHGYGYANPQSIPHPEHRDSGEQITVSLPMTKHDDPNLTIPLEGQQVCRAYLAQCLPELAERPWLTTRICWYNDTIRGDWLIDRHPAYAGLFVATGGSGHGYKFLPVVGERIVDVMLDKPRNALGKQLREKWRWPTSTTMEHFLWTDEWRGGKKGMHLQEELSRRQS